MKKEILAFTIFFLASIGSQSLLAGNEEHTETQVTTLLSVASLSSF